MLKGILWSLAVLVAGTTAALATTVAVSTANVNLRAGPAVTYPVVVVVPQGSQVVTYGCIDGYTWCDVAYGGVRGWIAADYMTVVYNGATVVLTPAVATAVSVNLVVYDRVYWDTHYVAQPWYGSWTTHYGAPVTRSTAVVGPNDGTGSRTTGCVGLTCGTTATATGAYGGAATSAAGCGPYGCARGGTATGPEGNTMSGGRACGPRGCGAAVNGPQGNTATRRIVR